jgi:hypothetical protein
MLNKVKQWLGIEGVKIELLLPETVLKKTGIIQGEVQFMTLHTQTVQGFTVRLIEVYERGRGNEKLISEYELGQVTLSNPFDVPAEQPIAVHFSLPFNLVKSEIDALEERNLILSGIAKLAKLTRGVQSTFRVECEAFVKGTRLSPFDKKPIILK